jgi:hypothetical protein
MQVHIEDLFKQLFAAHANHVDHARQPCNRIQLEHVGLFAFSFLRRVSQVAADQLQQRVVGELTSTFVANYTRVIASGKDSSPY